MKVSKYLITGLLLLSLILAVACQQIASPVSSPTPSNTSMPNITPPAQNTTINVSPTLSASIPSTTKSSPAPSQTHGSLTVSFLDVGQADCTVIQYGSSSMIIDAGGNSTASSLVSEIKNMGISKFDIVVGTHPHEDHIGGLDAVINNFDIGTISMPKVSNNTQTFMDVLTAIQHKGLTVTTPIPGNTFTLGNDIKCTIFAPNGTGYSDLNSYSIVIKVVYGNTSFLFTGDAETDSEQEMLVKGFDLKSDVLKVGHHGSTSSTSTAFLNAVSPKNAVIFVGKDNIYGHPHRETLDKLNAAGVKIYRTDLNGTIEMVSDGSTINVSPQHAVLSTPTSATIIASISPSPTVTAPIPISTSSLSNPTPTPTSTVTTTASIQITNIFYDGLVPSIESDEYVEISNPGTTAVDLNGWTLKDVADGTPSFRFPAYTLEPGTSIRVYTNENHPEYGGFNFGYGKAIWNNTARI